MREEVENVREQELLVLLLETQRARKVLPSARFRARSRLDRDRWWGVTPSCAPCRPPR